MAEYDAFYAELEKLLKRIAQHHRRFVVFDLHAYNFRRQGANGAEADPAFNPEINIGTGSLDRVRWDGLVDRFIEDLAAFDFLGRHLDVRENIKFKGRELAQWIHNHFSESACVLSIEFKKFYMDEWTGVGEVEQIQGIRDALQSTMPGILQELDQYRQQDPSLNSTVAIRDDIPGILVSHGNLLIGKDASVHRSRLNAIINHEVGTHIVTHHNGNQQPFRELYVGMAGYEAMQEGLAVMSEYLAGELQASRLRLLAGRVLAAHLITSGASFADCFHALYKEQGFQARTAFNVSMRIFRGGGYTKDLVYLRGLGQLLQTLADGYPLESLYLGKISHQHLGFIEEPQWRKILKPPALRPIFLDAEDAQARLQALSKGLTVNDLINE